jgi:hypothetical protein
MRASLQNRVTPYSVIESTDARGTLMGNRGVLHNEQKSIIRNRSSVHSWVCCLTSFKGRKRVLMSPGRYTELFFLDEATALAAGHRPCGECRPEAYKDFKRAFAKAFGAPTTVKAKDIDTRLFPEMKSRLDGAPLATMPLGDLCDGVMLEITPGTPLLLWEGKLHAWTHEGYTTSSQAILSQSVRVITPPTNVAILKNGYKPVVHSSINAAEST